MKNRLICIFVILSLVLSGISVVAEYTPGKTIQELELSEGEMNLEMNKEQINHIYLKH